MATYYERNKEKIKEKQRLYREKNKDKIRIRDRKWYEKNRDKIKEKNMCKKEEFKVYNKKYYKKNKKKMIHQIIRARWIRLYDIDIDMSDELLENQCNSYFEENEHELNYFLKDHHYNSRNNYINSL